MSLTKEQTEKLSVYREHVATFISLGYQPEKPETFLWDGKYTPEMYDAFMKVYNLRMGADTIDKIRKRRALRAALEQINKSGNPLLLLASYQAQIGKKKQKHFEAVRKDGTVESYKGKMMLKKNALQIAKGKYAGRYIHNASPHKVVLYGGKIATSEDKTVLLYQDPDNLDNKALILKDEEASQGRKCERTKLLFVRDACHEGYIGRGRTGYFTGGIHGRYPDRWFISEEVAIADGYAFSNYHGMWMPADHTRFNSDMGNGNAGYHHYSRKFKEQAEEFTVGVEVEKEDDSVVGIPHTRVNNTTGWYKERDGSLSHDTGFELVSPTYDLMKDTIFNDIDGSEDLIKLINAKHSKNCGGHIHVGKVGATGETLIDMIAGYLPLLYSIYSFRVNGQFSLAKSLNKLKADRAKYQSVQIFDNRIEIRIFPAVKNVANLKWRIRLVRHMVTNPCYTTEKMFEQLEDDSSPLFALLREVLTENRVRALIKDSIKWKDKVEKDMFVATNRDAVDSDGDYMEDDDE